jgi:hypothetical protein
VTSLLPSEMADSGDENIASTRVLTVISTAAEFSGGARVSGARGQLSCLSPPSRWACGHPSSDVFFFLVDSFASYSALNLSIHSHSMKSMNKIMEDP